MRHRFLLATAGIVAVLTAIPRRTVVVPPFTIVVVDSTGAPVAGACVTEVSRDYTIETEDSAVTRRSDAEGRVTMPVRELRASALARVLGATGNFVQGFVHASYGPHAYALVRAPDAEGFLFLDHASPAEPQRVVLTPTTQSPKFRERVMRCAVD